MNILARVASKIHLDWYLFLPALLLSLAGLVTMDSFTGDNYYFVRQSIWILVSVIVFLLASAIDWQFLRRTIVLVPLYLFVTLLLGALFIIGHVTHGAQSWFQLGSVAFQPSDFAKVVLILMLAKFFSRRHIEIKNIRHIVVSALYAFIMFILVFLQPDFGGAIIIFAIWLGMVLVSGISKKHLGFVFLGSAVVVALLWIFVFAPYQKSRIVTFLHPLSDIRGAGYNAYQSTVAVGSGRFFGKGVGQGSQSKLQYLPEYQTDFIFAAFAEEWGFVGTFILLSLCLALLFRLVSNAGQSATNFETLFNLGFVILIGIHIAINAGMNMGLLPVTGITFPFMSYGGSHLVTEWVTLGVLSSMKRHSAGPRV